VASLIEMYVQRVDAQGEGGHEGPVRPQLLIQVQLGALEHRVLRRKVAS
jgi:hypothetical protein